MALRHKTWVEIDYRAIEENARTLASLLAENAVMMGVVKSNAYGHGMVLSAKAALRGGATWLAVDELAEALELRKKGVKAPVLVLGYTFPESYTDAAAKNISLCITSLDALQELSRMKFSKKPRIHLKFETGLYRQGISDSHVQQVIRIVTSPKFPATIEGIYTHLAAAEDPLREEYSRRQSSVLKDILAKFRAKGLSPLSHVSPSAGLLFKKNPNFDISRAGIALYGLWPSGEIKKWAGSVVLRPALTWKTIVSEVKLASKGTKVGYDLTYELSRDSRLAIIPVGYWHGVPRHLTNKGVVLVKGKRANIVGRVSMDITIIDVTDIPTVKPGDEVVIIGTQGGETVSAEELAGKADTINYELVTRINPLLPRIAL